MFDKTPLIIKLLFVLLFIILFFYGIIVAKSFLSSIVLGIIFSYMVYPLVKFLERKAHFPRILSILVSIILLLGVLSFAFFILYRNIGLITQDMPALVNKAHQNIDQLGDFIERVFGYTVERQNLLVHDFMNNLSNSSSNFTQSIFRGTTSTMFIA